MIPGMGDDTVGLLGLSCAASFCRDTYHIGGTLLPLCKRLVSIFTGRSCQVLLEACQAMTNEALKDVCDGIFANCCVAAGAD